MSSVSSTSTLASWDPMELFELVNPDKLSITCVGYAPSCRRRCRNPIAYHNVQAAKELTRQIVRPGRSDDELKGMLSDLAGYTLCRRYHQNQARTVSDRWFAMVQRQLGDEDDHGSDTSEDDDDGSDSDSSTGSGSDTDSNDDDDDSNGTTAFNDNAGELRRRVEELETLQREFEELLQRRRQNLRSRAPSSSTLTQTHQVEAIWRPPSEIDHRNNTTHQSRKSQGARRNAEQLRQEEAHQMSESNRAAVRDQLRRERAERVKRDDASHQARPEKVEREATAEAERALKQQQAEKARLKREQAQREAKAEAERLLKAQRAERARLEREQARREAKAEAERLSKKQQAEQARLDREQKIKEQERLRTLSWESTWNRYETAWNEFTSGSSGSDISTCAIWPTKSGLFQSCCEEDVKTFFHCRPEGMNRRMVRRQALRWHPDHAARLFASVMDQKVAGEMLKTVTMISQVVIGIMGVTAL